MFVIYINKIHMFVICVNTSCNMRNSAENWSFHVTIVKNIHTFVVVEIRQESIWMLNEITIRGRVEEDVMAANFASR